MWTVDWGLKALCESEIALATITIDFYRLTERYLCRLHGVNLRPPNIFSLRRRWRRQRAATTGCAVCPSHSRRRVKWMKGVGGRVNCVQAPLVIICKECRSALLVSANLSFAAAAAAYCDVVVGSAARAGAAAWQVFFWLLAVTTTATATATAAAAWLLGLAFILLYPVGRWQSQQGMPSYAGALSCSKEVYCGVLIIDHFYASIVNEKEKRGILFLIH